MFPPEELTPPLLVTVFLGANDAALPDRSSARQHVPLEDYKQNLAAIVTHVQHRGVQNIVLVTPPPVHEAGRVVYNQQRTGNLQPEPAERTNDVTKAYAEGCKEVTFLAAFYVWK